MKYIKTLSLLGIGCIISLLFIFGVKLDAKNTIEKESNEVTVSNMKSVGIPNAKLITSTQHSSKWNPQQNYKNSQSNDNQDFYQVIIDYSLFRPLGWKPPNKEPEYKLLGTALDLLGIHSTAYVLERRSDAFHSVRIGETVGDMVVREIEDKKIVLDKNGESITLRTGDIEFLKTVDSSSRKQDRSVYNENKDDNNGRSSEAFKRTGYSVTLMKNSVSRANQRNQKKATKNAEKEFKSLSKVDQKIVIEKKLVDMGLKKSLGSVTIELKEK